MGDKEELEIMKFLCYKQTQLDEHLLFYRDQGHWNVQRGLRLYSIVWWYYGQVFHLWLVELLLVLWDAKPSAFELFWYPAVTCSAVDPGSDVTLRNFSTVVLSYTVGLCYTKLFLKIRRRRGEKKWYPVNSICAHSQVETNGRTHG